MIIALVILGLSTALLAVWCWWLTGKVVQLVGLLDDAATTQVRLAETVSWQNGQLEKLAAVAISQRKG